MPNGAEHYLAGEEELGTVSSLLDQDETWNEEVDASRHAQREIELRTAAAIAHFEAARAAVALASGNIGRDPGQEWRDYGDAAPAVRGAGPGAGPARSARPSA